MSKSLSYRGRPVSLADPTTLNFATKFHEAVYRHIYSAINGHDYRPYVDADTFSGPSAALDLRVLGQTSSISVTPPSSKASNPDRLYGQIYLKHFLNSYPEMVGLVRNTTLLAELSIANAEYLLGAKCTATNFIEIKRIIDDINALAWSRDKDVSERQSGVSTLGTISETLLTRAFDSMVDDVNFFKVGSQAIQSYGDFVLMCLPNNLWLSVKSNFARERLLASGYSNDILGVGFFEDFTEFTSQVRVRNFQRAGFLAMYCPDVAVNQDQLDAKTSTYDQIANHHKACGTMMPRNINGQPFIRRLSDLQNDLQNLLAKSDIKSRFTVSF